MFYTNDWNLGDYNKYLLELLGCSKVAKPFQCPENLLRAWFFQKTLYTSKNHTWLFSKKVKLMYLIPRNGNSLQPLAFHSSTETLQLWAHRMPPQLRKKECRRQRWPGCRRSSSGKRREMLRKIDSERRLHVGNCHLVGLISCCAHPPSRDTYRHRMSHEANDLEKIAHEKRSAFVLVFAGPSGLW